jgi:outer membrane lipoprotein SlyB
MGMEKLKSDQVEQMFLVSMGLIAACMLVWLGDNTLAGTIAGGALGYMTPRPKAGT